MALTVDSPREVAEAARAGSRTLAILSAEQRNAALLAMHAALREYKQEVLSANARDVEAAQRKFANNEMSQSMLNRLDLSRPGKYEDMLQGILDVAKLPDPLNRTTARTLMDDGLVLERVSCPIGVIVIIFESRPEVIANISALAIKSGNAAILKGGKESTATFAAISTVISRALEHTAVPEDSLQLVETHDAVDKLIKLDKYIDLCIPRGGNALVQYIKKNSSIPVLGHADGICCTYLAADYPVEKAVKIILDAKTSYPAGCNALEQLLVDEAALQTSFPVVAKALISAGVTLHCDLTSYQTLRQILDQTEMTRVRPGTPNDYKTEYLGLDIALFIMPSLDHAIGHINAHSSHHTDAILTSSRDAADRFLAAVDSSSVYWNTSTRMADGQRYGFGTEVGISTNKIHSRGPVGLEGLTIYKWLLRGDAQISAEYGDGKKPWRHIALPIQAGEAIGGDEGKAKDVQELEMLRNFRAARQAQLAAAAAAQA